MEVWNKERNVAECFVVMPKKDALFALVGFAVAPQLLGIFPYAIVTL